MMRDSYICSAQCREVDELLIKNVAEQESQELAGDAALWVWIDDVCRRSSRGNHQQQLQLRIAQPYYLSLRFEI